MEVFFEYCGFLIQSLQTAIQIPFQILNSTASLLNFMPTLLATSCVVVLSFGIVKLIVGWI